jgi:CRISPR system Cascade subunit CasD
MDPMDALNDSLASSLPEELSAEAGTPALVPDGRKTLLMRLAAPLQSWGTSSRFTRRATDFAPSKSGVIGMLASAQGIRRTDELADDLLRLRFGVRIDQPGTMLRDFQTTKSLDDPAANGTLAERYYLSDAVFLAAVEGEAAVVDGLADALMRPKYQLFLGRRSCPPGQKVLEGVVSEPLEVALKERPWLAGRHHRRGKGPTVRLEVVRDANREDERKVRESVRDQPISFNSTHRQYDWRQVVRERVEVAVGDSTGMRGAVESAGEARTRRPEGVEVAHDPFWF